MLKRGELARVGLRTKIVGLLLCVLLLLSAAFVAFTYLDQRERTASELLEKSRVLVDEMEAVWDFVSINQDTINYTSDGVYDYKSLHCAIAGKSVAVLFSQKSGYSMRFTNLNPRNLNNEPDAYEQEAIEAFTAGSAEERYGYADVNGVPAFRYVSAMRVSENCIECHGKPAGELDPTGYPKEGWETGDIAGAVSVVVPTEAPIASMFGSIVNYALFFVVLMICMAVLIYLSLSRLITNPLTRLRASLAQVGDGAGAFLDASESVAPTSPVERDLYSSREVDELFAQFDSMAQRLSELYASLELQVAERTAQLSQANDELTRQRQRVEEINAQLARDNRYKSDFLAIVSHELRTPLTSILAFTELLADSVDAGDAASRRQLEEIEKNGGVLLEMVDNVLETARIQAGSERLNLELVDLNDIVGMVRAANEPVAQKKGVAMSAVVDAHVPLIMSDWEKVRRVLVNLVSNAVKFTPSGGRVDVRVRCAPGGPTDAGAGEAGGVLIEVRDTGIGIPADKQELVFERFTQENMSTVRRYGGSGLGLSLVKDLVAMLGGAVRVESAVGEGSTFFVRLPLHVGEASEAGAPAGGPEGGEEDGGDAGEDAR